MNFVYKDRTTKVYIPVHPWDGCLMEMAAIMSLKPKETYETSLFETDQGKKC